MRSVNIEIYRATYYATPINKLMRKVSKDEVNGVQYNVTELVFSQLRVAVDDHISNRIYFEIS